MTALNLCGYVLALLMLMIWRDVAAPSWPDALAQYGPALPIAAVLAPLGCYAVRWLGKTRGAIQRYEVLAMALGWALVTLIVAGDDSLHWKEEKWPLVISFVLFGSAAFFRSPLAVSTYLAIVGGGLIAIEERGSAAATLAVFTTVWVYWLAHQQARLVGRSVDRARHMEERARAAEAVIRSLEESGDNWLWETGVNGNLTYVSPKLVEAFAEDEASLLGSDLLQLLRSCSTPAEQHSAFATLEFFVAAKMPFREIMLPVNVQGADRWFSISGGPLFDERNQFTGYSGIGTDVTAAHTVEDQVRRLALFDSLTGLPNRRHFHDIVGELLSRSLSCHSPCALMFIDLDRFKIVNDTLGHPIGDELLRNVAGRIQNVLRGQGQAGRLGGDEFVLILPNGPSLSTVQAMAEKLIAEISAPYYLGSSQVLIGASIGIAMGPSDGSTTDDLIRHADLALYAAKEGGRGRSRFYDSAMRATAEIRRALEMDLRSAISDGQLQLFYQPIFDMTKNCLAGFEALLRWDHPERGMVSPELFIPIAEEAGLISRVGEWVLRTAFEQASVWPEHITIAVNLSPSQLQDGNLTATITSALAASQINPSRVELEITESVFLQETPTTYQTLASIRSLGFRLALDDFGTGYSSLGYLRKASFNKIKIDRSFVQGLDLAHGHNYSIVRAVVALADSLGMITTAEGAETQEEVEALRKIGCRQVQGFAYAKPMNLESATALALDSSATVDQILQPRARRRTLLKNIRVKREGDQHSGEAGILRNISTRGASIAMSQPIALGVDLELEIPGVGTKKGEVRWTQTGRFGVMFHEPIPVQDLIQIGERGSNHIGAAAA